MPIISVFLGIVIRMYLGNKEHNPPHFHAIYGDYEGIFDIHTCKMIHGDLPRKQIKRTEVWAELHQEELMANWTLARNGEDVLRIAPLQ